MVTSAGYTIFKGISPYHTKKMLSQSSASTSENFLQEIFEKIKAYFFGDSQTTEKVLTCINNIHNTPHTEDSKFEACLQSFANMKKMALEDYQKHFRVSITKTKEGGVSYKLIIHDKIFFEGSDQCFGLSQQNVLEQMQSAAQKSHLDCLTHSNQISFEEGTPEWIFLKNSIKENHSTDSISAFVADVARDFKIIVINEDESSTDIEEYFLPEIPGDYSKDQIDKVHQALKDIHNLTKDSFVTNNLSKSLHQGLFSNQVKFFIEFPRHCSLIGDLLDGDCPLSGITGIDKKLILQKHKNGNFLVTVEWSGAPSGILYMHQHHSIIKISTEKNSSHINISHTLEISPDGSRALGIYGPFRLSFNLTTLKVYTADPDMEYASIAAFLSHTLHE